MEHVYKDLLIAKSEGKEIQYRYIGQSYSWVSLDDGNLTALKQLFLGVTDVEYEVELRIKPRTHIVNGHEINAPEVKMPAVGCAYWFPIGSGRIDYFDVCNDDEDKMYLHAGLMYLAKEDAQAHSNAWMNQKV